MRYSFRALITDETAFTLDLLLDAIKEAFAEFPLIEVKPVHRTEDSWDKNPALCVYDRELGEEWTLTITESKFLMDPDERATILKRVARRPDYQKIASCKKHWLWGESDLDDDVEYLDIYATIVETLDEFPGVYVFDKNLKLFTITK